MHWPARVWRTWHLAGPAGLVAELIARRAGAGMSPTLPWLPCCPDMSSTLLGCQANLLNTLLCHAALSTALVLPPLQGPTSSGKTSLVSYLAAQTGHTFVRINNHEQTDLQASDRGRSCCCARLLFCAVSAQRSILQLSDVPLTPPCLAFVECRSTWAAT